MIFQEEDMKDLNAQFDKYDTNHDGHITRKELIAFLIDYELDES